MRKKKYSKKAINNFENNVSDKKFKFNKKSILIALISIGIISIMIGSALSLWGEDSESSYKYNGYKFVKSNEYSGGWKSYIDGNWYSFNFLPSEVENLTNLNINSNNYYLIFDPKDVDGLNKALILKQELSNFNIISFPACIKEEGCGDFPIYNCNSVTDGINIISNEENKIYKNNNCLVIEGNYEYFLKSINYFRYKLLGIIQ